MFEIIFWNMLLMVSDGGEERQEVSVNCSFLVQKLAAFTNYTFYVRAYSSKSASDQSKRTNCQTGEGGESLFLSSTRIWAPSRHELQYLSARIILCQNMQNYNLIWCFVWLWGLVSHMKGREKIVEKIGTKEVETESSAIPYSTAIPLLVLTYSSLVPLSV